MTSTLNLLRNSAAALATISLLSLTSCTPLQQQGAGVGALAGGVIGGVAGDDTGDVLKGAAIGAAAGTGAAALKEASDRRKGSSNPGSNQPATATDAKHPTGYKTQNPFQVISPYKPNNLIDISKNPKTGQPFQSGDLVKDPSNGGIFRIP